MLPPGLSTEKNEEIRFDPSKAQQLLLQGLEEEGLSFSDLSQITLYYRQGQVNQRLAQTLQKIWKEVLGITFKIEQLDHKSHLQKLHKKDYQIAMASWIAQYHDPMSLLERFKFKENPKNFPNWEDMKYIALLEKASNCTDLSERTLALQEAERFFLEQLPIIPLYHWTAPYVAQPNVHNISTTASGGILLENFSL
jgi:oligopeptide transport system substrate-binding protein